jgi:hypothetical protein
VFNSWLQRIATADRRSLKRPVVGLSVGIFHTVIPKDVPTTIAMVGLFATLIGASVALFNSWKAVRWKRAELANSYIKEFNSNDEMVFAGRCLDWEGGRLFLPEKLRAYLPDEAHFIEHDKRIMAKALRHGLTLEEDDDPRIQIYRTSMDSFLSWLSLVASGLNRKLFLVEDIEEVGYWVSKIQSESMVHGFIVAYGYQERMLTLITAFRRKRNPYRNWHFIRPEVIRIIREALQSRRPQREASNAQEPPHHHASPSRNQEAATNAPNKPSSET